MLVGVINKILVEGTYKICPDCGRIYNDEEDMNYCPQCVGEPLKKIRITLE